MTISNLSSRTITLAALTIALAGCSRQPPSTPSTPPPSYFKPDPATAAQITGHIRYLGPTPRPRPIDMSNDPACVTAHHGKAFDPSLIVAPDHSLSNAFVYISHGLEGKTFETPTTPITINQTGCGFEPHVAGVQTGQPVSIVNSDPTTHNIHPMAQINREWNHSQGPGDPPLTRRFLKAEVMIPIKCNIHSWMRSYLGVLDHPYFAVTKDDGTFTIPNLPPGTYTLAIWHERLGTQQQQITVEPHGHPTIDITFKDK